MTGQTVGASQRSLAFISEFLSQNSEAKIFPLDRKIDGLLQGSFLAYGTINVPKNSLLNVIMGHKRSTSMPISRSYTLHIHEIDL